MMRTRLVFAKTVTYTVYAYTSITKHYPHTCIHHAEFQYQAIAVY